MQKAAQPYNRFEHRAELFCLEKWTVKNQSNFEIEH